MELKRRLSKINSLKNEVDGVLLFSSDPTFFYFTNSFAAETFYYDFSSPMIISSEMSAEQAREGWVKRIEKIDTRTMSKRSDFVKTVTERFDKGEVIGINKKALSASFFSELRSMVRLKDIGDKLDDARMVKTDYEIKCISRACSIGKRVFNEVKGEIKPGVTENRIAGLFELAARSYDTKLAPDVIVAFGSNTKKPHHSTTGKRLKKGEPVLIDFGICYKGYYSDVTRMLNSRPYERLKEIMRLLDPMIKPDIKASSLEKFVRNALGRDEQYFTHALGHGIGVAIHEKPWVSLKSKDILKPGMVFTIEPGLYMKSEGARIEDVFLMTKNGKKRLS